MYLHIIAGFCMAQAKQDRGVLPQVQQQQSQESQAHCPL